MEKVRNARGMWKKGEIGLCRGQTMGVPGKGRIDVDSNPGLLDTGNDPVKMGRRGEAGLKEIWHDLALIELHRSCW